MAASVRGVAVAAVVLTASCPGMGAAEEAGWQVSVTPYLWIAGVSGDIRTPNPASPDRQVNAGFGDLLSNLNGIPVMLAAEVRHGRLALLADIIAISVKADVATPGGLFNGGSASVTQVIGSALGTYRVVAAERQALDVGLGVRAFGLSTKFSLDAGALPPRETSPGISWADPIAGARYHIDFGPRWGATAYGDIGAGPDSPLTWQVLGTIDYRIGESTVMRAGYRHLAIQFDGNLLHQNVRLSGPIIGATFQF